MLAMIRSSVPRVSTRAAGRAGGRRGRGAGESQPERGRIARGSGTGETIENAQESPERSAAAAPPGALVDEQDVGPLGLDGVREIRSLEGRRSPNWASPA